MSTGQVQALCREDGFCLNLWSDRNNVSRQESHGIASNQSIAIPAHSSASAITSYFSNVIKQYQAATFAEEPGYVFKATVLQLEDTGATGVRVDAPEEVVYFFYITGRRDLIGRSSDQKKMA